MTKVMLVEDDNNLREIYGARLMAEGYQIVSASDGEEALALAVKEKPELIVADVMMPKISGFDMLDILRTTPETKNTKVIIMTALSQPEDRARGESLGADKYLVKSQVTLEDVVAAVHEILGDSGGDASSAPAANANPAADGASGDTPQTVPQKPAAPAAPPTQPDKPQVPPTKTEDQPPKAEGASDAPEPASKKKKIIKPINDLSHEKEDFLKMVAEEEAKEKQSTPGAAVGPTDDASKQQINMAESMAEEKKQMEEEVKKMVNDGTIDNEATAAPVDPNASDSGQGQAQPQDNQGGDQGGNQSTAADGQAQPATQTPTPSTPPAKPAQPAQPPADNTQPKPEQPAPAKPPGPPAADAPQPGSSVQPQTKPEGAQSGKDETAEASSAVGGTTDNQTPQPPAPQTPTPSTPPAKPAQPPTSQTQDDPASKVPQPPKKKPEGESGDSSGQNPGDVAL